MMRMTVDKSVYSVSVGYNRSGSPKRRGLVYTEMSDRDHIIRALRPGGIHRFLNVGIKLGAVRPAGNTVYKVIIFIFKIADSDIFKSLGRSDSDKSYFLSVCLKYFIRVKNGISLFPIGYIVKITGNIRKIRGFREIENPVHSIIELMIAESRQIISGGVHYLNNPRSVIHCPVRSTGDMVSRVDQKNVVFSDFSLQFLFHRRETRISEIRV